MIDVSVIMPCKGRPEQTAALLPRLWQTAGKVRWELICVIDEDPASADAIRAVNAQSEHKAGIIELPERQGYWKALAHGTRHARGRILANIANDVLPGLDWLSRAVFTFDRLFPDGRGVVGWNDGLLFEGHTGHLLIGKGLAHEWYGEAHWPTFYDHLFGDTEICQHAMMDGLYVIDTKAVLFHNHPAVGQLVDGVYRFSHTHQSEDQRLFEQRRGQRWPTALASSSTP